MFSSTKQLLKLKISFLINVNAFFQDGRLQAGDHILFVNGESLIGVSQEK